jgi:geranylgeranyl pyrophosphate synthase
MLTLPLIHMFSLIEEGERKKIQRQMKRYSKRKNQAAIKEMINNYGGIEYSYSQMERISNQALAELDQFSDSEYKVAMTSAVNFNLERVL